MSVKRKPGWKQVTPREQLIVLLQNTWGHLDNQISESTYLNRGLANALKDCSEAIEIVNQMNEGDYNTWEEQC